MADGFGWPVAPSRTTLPVLIDSTVAVAHRGWREARDSVLQAVAAGPRLILILGGPGSGKSLLLRALAARLRGEFDVLLLERGDRRLVAGAADGRRRVVLVDQAWRLNEAAFDGLRRLGDCTVVLAGLRDQSAGARLSDAAARVVMLPPIGEDDVAGFVAKRLAWAGLPQALFGAAALAALTEQAGGQVRRLSMLMSAALDVAHEHGVAGVDRLEVEQAAQRLDQPAWLPHTAPHPAAAAAMPMTTEPGARDAWLGLEWRGIAAAAAGLALVIGVAGWLARPARTALLAPPNVTAPVAGLPQLAVVPPSLQAAPAGDAVLPPHLADAAPDAGVALPVEAPARVVLLVARGDAAAAERASGMAMTLAARGLTVETRAVRAVGAGADARYFFAEDRGTAESVLVAAGVVGRTRQAAPGEAEATLRPGLIELVLPAGGPAIGEPRTRLVQTNMGGRVP